MSTGAILGLSVLAVAVLWGVVEYRTLTDSTPNNHISAVVRRAVKTQPGPFILLAFDVGFICGHLFWA